MIDWGTFKRMRDEAGSQETGEESCSVCARTDCAGCEIRARAAENYLRMMRSMLRLADTMGEAYDRAKRERQPEQLIRVVKEDRRNLKMAVALLVRLGVDMGFLPEPDGMMSTEDRKEAVGDVSGTD